MSGRGLPSGRGSRIPLRQPACVRRPGRILIIRGIFNVFSLGMDTLACRLKELGYRVDVTPPSMATIVARQIENDYRRDPNSGPLVIIGHSMGGRYCCSIPWEWRRRGIPVRLVVILDSNPDVPVADNVQRCVNLYVTNNLGIFHGRPVWGVSPHSDLVNTDVTRLRRPAGVPPIDHFNIDDLAWIHAMVVREVQAALDPVADSDRGVDRFTIRPSPRRPLPTRQAAARQSSPSVSPPLRPALMCRQPALRRDESAGRRSR